MKVITFNINFNKIDWEFNNITTRLFRQSIYNILWMYTDDGVIDINDDLPIDIIKSRIRSIIREELYE